ncbi:MAG: orotate phosphoribosyltransferase [Desulfobacteraceae bacterium]|nr:orotate phosphoribosyltransferase [Desulfobacteraceae bacterium]
MKKELIKLLKKKSFKHSEEAEFKLASGKMSHFYINCKPVMLNPRGMYLIGNLIFDAIKDTGCTAVGGLTFGADPIAVATAFASEINSQPIKAFSIRKEQKDHGMIKWLEGDIKKGEKIVIIDDVATTGGSTIKAIQRAKEEGLDPILTVILVDRQEGGLENILKHVGKAIAIVTRDELLAI